MKENLEGIQNINDVAENQIKPAVASDEFEIFYLIHMMKTQKRSVLFYKVLVVVVRLQQLL